MSTTMSATYALDEFIDYLSIERNYSLHTIASYKRDITSLSDTFTTFGEIDSSALQKIVMIKNAQGKSSKTIKRFISSVRSYIKYVEHHHDVSVKPLDIILPKNEKKLPKTMSYEEIMQLINMTFHYPEELRDKAIIALLYSAALRVSELVALDTNDIDSSEGFVKVWGKGAKHRFTPIGNVALTLIQQYISSRTHNNNAVFLNTKGNRISTRAVQMLVKKRAECCGFDFRVYPHMFRHSAASHFLQSSSNIRMTQEYLGHKHITSTQVYTHLDVMKLAEVYDKTHPHQNTD